MTTLTTNNKTNLAKIQKSTAAFFAALADIGCGLEAGARAIKDLDDMDFDYSADRRFDGCGNLIQHFRRIAHGQLLPALACQYLLTDRRKLGVAAKLTIPDQKKVAADQPVDVGYLIDGQFDTRPRKLSEMETDEYRRAFRNGHINTPAEQRTTLEKAAANKTTAADKDENGIIFKNGKMYIPGIGWIGPKMLNYWQGRILN